VASQPKKLVTIGVLMASGRVAFVDAELAYGDYAVHRRFNCGHPSGEGYSVTHIPSGLVVWSVRTFLEAEAVAQFLDEANELPPDRDAVLGIQKLGNGSPTIVRLSERLAAIAPRYLEKFD
jgi:hypothetical protein